MFALDDDEPSDGLIYLNGTIIIKFKKNPPKAKNGINICMNLNNPKAKTNSDKWESAAF